MNLLRLITFRKGAAGGLDPDAQAFITAAGITDPTQQSAINQLVLDLKGYSLWSKMKAVYPFVGGTATTHKYNLIDPQDTDAAFRLTFNGGWTHSSNGATPNGSTGYANTHLIPSTALSQNNSHISMYSRSSTASVIDMGAYNSGSTGLFMYLAIFGSLYGMVNSNSYTTQSVSNALGLSTISRISSSTQSVYRNGSGTSSSINSTGITTHAIYLGALNQNGTATDLSNAQEAFVSIGDGLNATDVSNLYTAVQAYQTTLGRQV